MVDCIFRVGGEGGEGVISTGELLTQVIARAGYEIYTFRTYPAEIKGGHANYQVRASDQLLLSQGDHVDCLLAFNQEAYDKHIKDVRQGGYLVYDSDSYQPPANPDVVHLPIPLSSIATEQVGLKLTKNIVALGALSQLFDIPPQKFEELLRKKFGHKGEAVLAKNLQALNAGRQYCAAHFKHPHTIQLTGMERPPELILSGNEATALGAMFAGVTVYAGYPITPATDIMEFLAEELPKTGGVVVQTEDEIAAIGTVLGASFAGQKAMTATSGPGFSLMIEILGLATMAEIPAVVINVQRVGPSTGMPTKTEQGDLYLAVYGAHGSCPRIVLALTSVTDCFSEIVTAFNLAEQFQTPVIVLSDQYLGHRKATIPKPNLSAIPVINRCLPTAEELKEYKRYRFTGNGVSPMAVPGLRGGAYIATGLEHNEMGEPAASDAQNHQEMNAKRYRKFEQVNALSNELVQQYGQAQPEVGVMGWGSTEGVIREAISIAQSRGYSVGALHPKIVYPLPLERISRFANQLKYPLIIPELNFTGQFATLLRKRFPYQIAQLNKTTGLPFTPMEIVTKIEEVAGGPSLRNTSERKLAGRGAQH